MGTDDPNTSTPEDSASTPITMETLTEVIKGLQSSITDQVNGLAKATKAQMAQLKKQQEDQSKELAKLFAPATGDPADATPDPAGTTPADATPDPIATVRSQLERERRAREKELAAVRAEMEATKQEAARLQATKEFMSVAGDRAYDPEGLAIIAEHRGLLKQEGGRYLALVGQDEFSGEPLYKPLADGFDKILEQLPNFAKPRPGNGTGATAGESATPSTPRYTNPQEMMDAVMQSPDGGLSVLKEVKSS